MPRLPPSLLLQAYQRSQLLPLVLRGARTLDSSINELRWLKEHVQTLKPSSHRQARQNLLKLCQRRSRGEPLQYILGTQPFGELEIKCRPGVLIPRPETESYTTYLASLINGPKRSNEIPNLYPTNRKSGTPPNLRILDLCSGSGCISLLLHSLLSPKFPNLTIFGFDISPVAIKLAKENLAHNLKEGYLSPSALGMNTSSTSVPQVQFGHADILSESSENGLPLSLGSFQIIISNPPYISHSHFSTQTTRSVRTYEPLLALVPQDPNPDIFYARLIRLHQIYLSNVTVMEVGDARQAVRVVELALEMDYSGYRQVPRVRNRIEIWRDDPGFQDSYPDDAFGKGKGKGEVKDVRVIAGREVRFRGRGKVRAVVLFREMTDRHERYRGNIERRVVERLGKGPVISKEEISKEVGKELRMEGLERWRERRRLLREERKKEREMERKGKGIKGKRSVVLEYWSAKVKREEKEQAERRREEKGEKEENETVPGGKGRFGGRTKRRRQLGSFGSRSWA